MEKWFLSALLCGGLFNLFLAHFQSFDYQLAYFFSHVIAEHTTIIIMDASIKPGTHGLQCGITE
jgi:hypothetical protein